LKSGALSPISGGDVYDDDDDDDAVVFDIVYYTNFGNYHNNIINTFGKPY
jgi:hypothetical protein